MIETILLAMAIVFGQGFANTTLPDNDDDLIPDDNSTDGCDYYGGRNLRLDCPRDCPDDLDLSRDLLYRPYC